MKATEMAMRVDLRRRRAEALVHAVMQRVEPFLHDDVRMGDVYDALQELFWQNGVEVLTDHDRQRHGLPPRGPDGWTVEEMMALEQRRLEILTRPLTFTLPEQLA